MRLCVVVGAGASFGCGYEPRDRRPPLGRGAALFNDLERQFPLTWGALDDAELAEGFRLDFEAGMTSAWSRQVEGCSHLLIDMAIYFSAFEPPDSRTCHYTALVRELRNSRLLGRTGVISLNYDCVLEVAASRLRVLLCMNLAEPVPGQLLIFKPHGSCNFVPTAPVFDLTIQLTQPEQHYFAGPFEVQELARVREVYTGPGVHLAVPPVMSVFAPGKHNPVCDEQLQFVRKAAADWSSDAGVVLVIGARTNLADHHVWDPLCASDATFWVVGGDDPDLAQLRATVGPDRVDYIAPTFAEAIDEMRARLRALA